ncbi:hypothetical protein SISNIDRAFT_487076 [Sistotremastrum niveocremeum HHB9708]|uniref:F-box domain-containing protein n=1 Tax=Sistotremastrum niveocremeum HHB9708 TaxID=1314777 RepID=A0A164SSE9_9AGAM|nr:hypothetical protein SISNIDRAFT_487076 [Sistotremastrum niveocremeum HHB9708]
MAIVLAHNIMALRHLILYRTRDHRVDRPSNLNIYTLILKIKLHSTVPTQLVLDLKGKCPKFQIFSVPFGCLIGCTRFGIHTSLTGTFIEQAVLASLPIRTTTSPDLLPTASTFPIITAVMETSERPGDGSVDTQSTTSLPSLGELSRFMDRLDQGLRREMRKLLDNEGASRGSEFSAFQQTITEMSERLVQSERLLKTQRNVCSPAWRLADEMVLEILKHCEFFNENESSWEMKKVKIPPAFSLCAKWRNVAINSPSLWTRVRLPMSSKLLDLCLRRSKALPLKMSILCEGFLALGAKRLERYRNVLRDALPRINHLTIEWDEEEDGLDNFLCKYIGQIELSSLRTVKITDGTGDRRFDPPRATLNAPLLYRLEFYGVPPRVPFVVSDKLVELKLAGDSLYAESILLALARFPHLEHCDIVIDDPLPASPESHPRRIALPRLQSLRVTNLPMSEVVYFFRYLDIPDSANLKVGIEDDSPVPIPFKNFLGLRMSSYDELSVSHERGTACSLTSTSKSLGKLEFREFSVSVLELASHLPDLSVVNFDMPSLPSHADLIHILQCWPHLTHIGVHTRTKQFKVLLTALQDTSPLLCPRLQTLDCTGTKFSVSRMSHFLQFRAGHDAPLHKLQLTKGFVTEGIEELVALVPVITEIEATGKPKYAEE